MNQKNKNYIRYNTELVNTIFEQKQRYHHEQARLPIEQKIKILVELQKIVLETRPVKDPADNRKVWEI